MSVGLAAPRAPYACHPEASRGRYHDEPESLSRSAFRRDCDRVIHSTAFRRLKYKTQVFIVHEGDHYRTRLTHSLEVAQIARAIARTLGLDEDLTETLALAHDLGHPPFGHAGERALDSCLKDHGGFDHNVQALRVLTELEHRYPRFDGLNLTWETLEGVVKHNGPMTDADGHAAGRYKDIGLPWGMAEYDRTYGLGLSTYASLEAQIAAIADDIAYDAHDLDDGLRAGLFSVDDLIEIPMLAEMVSRIRRTYPQIDEHRLVAELVRDQISLFISGVVDESRKRLAAANPQSVDDVRNLGSVIVTFPEELAAVQKQIKAFLKRRMYRADRVMRVMGQAEQVLFDLFERYQRQPDDMPAEWHGGAADKKGAESEQIRRIGNFIAGMTDRFAITEHQRLFDSTPELR